MKIDLGKGNFGVRDSQTGKIYENGISKGGALTLHVDLGEGTEVFETRHDEITGAPFDVTLWTR